MDQKNLRFFRNFFCPNHEFFFFGGIEDYEKVVGILIFDFLLLRRMNNFWKKKLDKNKFFENYSFPVEVLKNTRITLITINQKAQFTITELLTL